MSDDLSAPPPEGMGEPTPAPEPNPWDNWRQAGIDPSAYNPYEVQNAARFFEALKNPDQRQQALGFFASQLREDERAIIAGGGQPGYGQQQADEPDPYYGDPGQEDYGFEGQPSGLTPEQVQEMIQRQFADFQRQQAEQQAQQTYQQEFERELLRVAPHDKYDDDERRWIAASALQVRQSDPYATTAQLMERAQSSYDAAVKRRAQQDAMRQQQANQQAVGLPNGDVPSPNQVPQSPEEAAAMYLRMTGNQG